MNNVIPIRTKYSTDEITVLTSNVQEILVIQRGLKFQVQLVLVSGRPYYLADKNNKDIFDTKEEAEALRDSFVSNVMDSENIAKDLNDIDTLADDILGD